MSAPNIPTPDSLTTDLLVHIFGQSSIIVVGWLFLRALWSWVSDLLKGAEIARGVIGRVMAIPPLARIVGLLFSVAVPALQALWLFTSYVLANGMSGYFGQRPQWKDISNWHQFIATMHWDLVTETYMAAAAFMLVQMYWIAFLKLEDVSLWGVTLVVIPPGLIGAASLGGVVLAWLGNLVDKANGYESVKITMTATTKQWVDLSIPITAVVAAYIVATILIAGTPNLLVNIWSPRRR